MSDLRERETVSVEEAAVILGVGRNLAYELAREYLETQGQRGLPVLQLHRRRLRVPVPALLRLLGEDSPHRMTAHTAAEFNETLPSDATWHLDVSDRPLGTKSSRSG